MMILFHKDNGFYAFPEEFVVFDEQPPPNRNWEEWFNENLDRAKPVRKVNDTLI